MNNETETYDDVEREWNRLVRDAYHSLEFLVTMHHIRKYFPPSGKILDAGGGPGRYSIELCRAGYNVVLLDLSPKCLALAKDKFKSESKAVQNRLLEFVLGDIQDLSRFEANHFDAVLCLGGPLTHISNETERITNETGRITNETGRITAMSELVRVAKPDAVVCISVVGLLAAFRTILQRYSHELLEPSFQTLVSQGDGTVGGVWWHFFRADELRELAESCGLTTIQMAGCEGLSTGLRDATNLLKQDEAKWQRWVELVLSTSAEPSVVDMGEHILYVGRAPKR